MPSKGNPGHLKLIRDDDSETGLSAAILLKNVRPLKVRPDGGQQIAKSEFTANFNVTVNGMRCRPKVVVMIYAQLNEQQLKTLRDKESQERAIARAPMIH